MTAPVPSGAHERLFAVPLLFATHARDSDTALAQAEAFVRADPALCSVGPAMAADAASEDDRGQPYGVLIVSRMPPDGDVARMAPTIVALDVTRLPQQDRAENARKLAPARTERFEALRRTYGADRPESADERGLPGRYALLVELGERNVLEYVATKTDAVVAAEAYLTGGAQPVCYFDLDALAGDAPSPREGDRITYQDRELWVVHASDTLIEGMLCWKLWLDENPQAALDDAEFIAVDESEVAIIEASARDPRTPKRYKLAQARATVAFDTTAS